jgi:hypothetical protein
MKIISKINSGTIGVLPPDIARATYGTADRQYKATCSLDGESFTFYTVSGASHWLWLKESLIQAQSHRVGQ